MKPSEFISDEIAAEILNRALEEEIGVAIEVTEQRLFANQLYRVRDAIADPKHQALIIFQPANGEVWLVKKATELD